MGNLTANISSHELLCKCGCCEFAIDHREPVVQIVQDACDYFTKDGKVTLEITSAARCNKHNRDEGSSDASRHTRADAMDIKIFVDGEQVPPGKVFKYLCDKYPTSYGIGAYLTFTHIDTRPWHARWAL